MQKFLMTLFAAVALCACGVQQAPSVDSEVFERGGPNAQFCGGFAAIECPDGYQCVDDPSDDCDPNAGGADCAGVCEKIRNGGGGGGNGSGAKDCERKRNQYLGDPEECATLRFVCPDGQQPFFDDCGCGCEDIPGEVCGDIVCPDGELCCNASCGICTPPGGVCTQQACDDNLG